ncbi:MAG TPA: hypothetical protein VMT94_02600 [Burkholderiales bacterium]|nr:hypothetical protein [Burkholderiales bacterium]
MTEQFHGTTIISARRGRRVALGGDGQVTFGNVVLKASARKVRRLYQDKILAGSGLRAGFANTDQLPSYTTVNLGATRDFEISSLGKMTARLALINAFDKIYEIRDGSGIGVGAPQFGERRALYAGLSKPF